eukprot:TRINITY_DN11000_c0_g1_i5.p2 TRINITY_DN11000_c0_g1~~TRINITY_DN11000_c0_g1_i5.p2  ORF type:complete len:372 (+),score=68.68 TRINITY_DN11000_c0_g1_i5:755-1870(+)
MGSRDGTSTLKEWQLQLSIKFYPTKTIAKHWSVHGSKLLLYELLNDLKLGLLEVAHDTAVALGAFAAQAIHGDYKPEQHADVMYLRNIKVTPYQDATLSERIRERHSQMQGMVTAHDALSSFITLCQEQELYGVGHLIKAKSETLPQTLHVGSSARGIHVYDHDRRIVIYAWPSLKRIFHRGKTFELTLREPGRKSDPVVFVMASAVDCKRCWSRAVQCHSFYRYRTSRASASGPTMVEAARMARQASAELMSIETQRLRRRSTFNSNCSSKPANDDIAPITEIAASPLRTPQDTEAFPSVPARASDVRAVAITAYDAKQDPQVIAPLHAGPSSTLCSELWHQAARAMLSFTCNQLMTPAWCLVCLGGTGF